MRSEVQHCCWVAWDGNQLEEKRNTRHRNEIVPVTHIRGRDGKALCGRPVRTELTEAQIVEFNAKPCRVCAPAIWSDEIGASEIRDLATMVRYFIARSGQTGGQISERGGLTAGFLSRIASGNRAPTRESLQKFARALRLSEHDYDRLLLAAGRAPESILIGGKWTPKATAYFRGIMWDKPKRVKAGGDDSQ